MENPESINPNKDVQLAEELDGLRASLSRLLVEVDKSRFALYQISRKQRFLGTSDCEFLRNSCDSLSCACANIALLTSRVFDHE